MEILKAKEYISEKLEIQPVSKDRLAHLKDKGFFIYQDRWGQAFVSPEALKSNKFEFVKRTYSISDAMNFIDYELEPTSVLYSAKMVHQLVEFHGFNSMDELLEAAITLFDPDTVGDMKITFIDNTLDLTKWLLEH